MDRPIIGVDVDDVCANLIGEWVRRYNLAYGDKLLPEQVTGWEISEFMTKAKPEDVHDLLAAPDFYDSVLPHVGARDTVDALKQQGRVVFITACHENTVDQKLRWLKRWGFLDANRNFIAAKDKDLIRADYLFDDRPENVAGFPGQGFLVNAFHNLGKQVSVPRGPFSLAPAFVQQVRPIRGAA